MSQDPLDRQWVAVALLARVRGIKGEIEALPVGGSLERCQSLGEVVLWWPEGAGPSRQAEVEAVWPFRDRWVFKFRGVDSISQAEPLLRAEVRIPASARPPVPEGEYYQTDLVGCQVADGRTGEPLGVVSGWREFGGPPLVAIEAADGQEILVPFAKAIFVEIDVAGRKIRVNLPEGLAELNRS